MAYLSTYRALPFCPPERTNQDIGPGTAYPAGFTLKEFVLLYHWGDFIAEGNLRLESPYPNQAISVSGYVLCSHWRNASRNYSPFTPSESVGYALGINVNKEAALGCDFSAPGYLGGSVISGYDTGSVSPVSYANSSIVNPSMSLGYMLGEHDLGYTDGMIQCEVRLRTCLMHEGLIYPFIRIRIGSAVETSAGVDSVAQSSTSYLANVEVLGKSVPVYYYDSSFYNSVDSFDFSIKTSNRWPYDPGDTDPYPGKDGSGPVYDSVTGAQLRNPFAIVKRGDGTFYNPNYTP